MWAPALSDLPGAERRGDGWWRVPVNADGEYALEVDGMRIADPRSAWQPHGVFGPSRLVDHSAFQWTDAGFQAAPLGSAIVYELHVGAFTPAGTFDSAIERLDHLRHLGVTHVELMPVNEFPGARGWGYDGVNLFAPHHAYGGPDGLKRLVDACHARGLAVILDVVYNHLGPSGNFLGLLGPYFTRRHSTPWGPAVNFDGEGSYEVRRFFCDNALMWLRDYHLDGLRLDAVHAIADQSAIHIFEQLTAEVRALSRHLGRHLALIAESDLNQPKLMRGLEAGGYGFDAQWSDDFHHALHVALTGERDGYYADFEGLPDVCRALQRAYVYDGRYSPYRGRVHGRPANGLSGEHFLGYLQNHDQIGNRARGDRASHLMSIGRQKIGAALVLLSPFVPMLFMGEEWGASTPFQYFTDHEDPDLRRAVSEGRKAEFAAFGWDPDQVPDPQDEATFVRSKLDWSEPQREPHREMLAWYTNLIALRRRMPELACGPLEAVDARCGEDWITMRRGRVLLACNLGRDEVALHAQGQLALGSEAAVRLTRGGISLPPDSVAVCTG